MVDDRLPIALEALAADQNKVNFGSDLEVELHEYVLEVELHEYVRNEN